MSDQHRMERIEDKIDKLSESLAETNQILAVNTSSLKDHMRRTKAVEKIVMQVHNRVATYEGAVKFIGLLALIVGIIAGIAEIVTAVFK